MAAQFGFVDVANVLIQADADVNQHCCSGSTPLIVASMNNELEMVKLLAAHPKIVVDLCENMGFSALDYASSDAHRAVRKVLKTTKPDAVPSVKPRRRPLAQATQVLTVSLF